jgi:2-C-methyl-D-erythritol 4-phosphate cytidylyltransferase
LLVKSAFLRPLCPLTRGRFISAARVCGQGSGRIWPMTTAVIVAAAGRGERLGPGLPKAMRLLAGEPLVVHAARSVAAAGDIAYVVVAAPPGEVASVRAELTRMFASDHLAVVSGGTTRQESVAAALKVLPDDVDVVLVHDAARPLTPPALFEAVARAVYAGHDAVIPGIAMTDTIKQVDAAGVVVATPDRTTLRAIQTPQGFRRTVLARAHATARRGDVTDDATLLERLGGPVHVVPGDPAAFKITGPLDLLLAEAVLAGRGAVR